MCETNSLNSQQTLSLYLIYDMAKNVPCCLQPLLYLRSDPSRDLKLDFIYAINMVILIA